MNLSISEVTQGFSIGPFTITNTMVWTWIIMAILAIFLIWLAKGAELNPTGTKQTIAEYIVELINNMVRSSMGDNKMLFAPYILAVISFLALSNLSGFLFLGFVRPPTADWATTLAMAVLTFSLVQGFGVGTNGLVGYLKGLADPVILTPLNIISEFAPIVSLSFRLFGNILGGLIIGTLIYSMIYLNSTFTVIWTVVAGCAIIFIVWKDLLPKLKTLSKGASRTIKLLGAVCLLPALAIMFVHFYFDIFSGLMQAYIFTMLTMMFIAAKIPDEWNA